MNTELYDFVLKSKQKGVSKTELRKELKNKGWNNKEIEEVFKSVFGEEEGGNKFIDKLKNQWKKGGPVVTVVVIGLVIAGGAFGALFTKTWDPGWNPFRPSPEEALTGMVDNMQDVELITASMDFDFSTTAGLGATGDVSVGVEMDGVFDTRDGNNKSEGDLKIDFSTEGFNMSGEGKFITVDKTSYLKIETLPAAPFLSAFVDVEKLKGKWLRFDAEDTESASQIDVDKLKEFLGDSSRYSVLNEESEDVNGASTYHYTLSFTDEGLRYLQENLSGNAQGSSDIFAPENEEARRRLKEIQLDVWVGKSDLLMYKTSLDEEFDNKTLNPESGDEGKVSMSLVLDITYPDELEEEISAPESSTTFEELMRSGGNQLQEEQQPSNSEFQFENGGSTLPNDSNQLQDSGEFQIQSFIGNIL